jgi:malic enzyme
VLFASGSPFDPIVDAAGVTHYPAQANNAYIFPAVGYAAVLAQAKEITDEVGGGSAQQYHAAIHCSSTKQQFDGVSSVAGTICAGTGKGDY